MATYTLKYPGHCRRCGKYLPAGTRVKWHHALGNECLECRFFAAQPTVTVDNSDRIPQNGEEEKETE